jgi:hypothetical protein
VDWVLDNLILIDSDVASLVQNIGVVLRERGSFVWVLVMVHECDALCDDGRFDGWLYSDHIYILDEYRCPGCCLYNKQILLYVY